jgi:hypothetical protein
MSDLAKLIEFFKSDGYTLTELSDYTAASAKKRDRLMSAFNNDSTAYLRVGLNLTLKFTLNGRLKGMD